MRDPLVWLLALATVVSAALWIHHDHRLWLERRPGAPRWKLYTGLWRYLGRGLYTPVGERSRRRALLFLVLTLVLFLLTLVVHGRGV
jgi:hypothetical protein